MIVYQLIATGIDWITCGGPRTIHSTTVFLTEEAARSRIAEFRKQLEAKHALLDNEALRIRVAPLEVIE